MTVSTSGPFINEFHYAQNGTDTGEFVEIAVPTGVSLMGWGVYFYDGATGRFYMTAALGGGTRNASNGFSFETIQFVATNQIQDGPDAIALVNAQGQVVEFLSYGGVFTATDGPAAGMTSTNVGASESETTSSSQSIARVGTGDGGSDFMFVNTSTSSPNSVNGGQTFTTSPPAPSPTPPPPPPPPPPSPTPGGTTFSVSDGSSAEGDTGETRPLNFTITRSSGTGTASVAYTFGPGPGTSASPDDFTSINGGTAYFADGQTSVTVHIPIRGDTAAEPNETVEILLTNPVGGTIADGQGIGTVINDDAAAPPPSASSTFSIADFSATETDPGVPGSISFTVTRTSGVGTASVYFAISDGPNPATTASSSDYGPNFSYYNAVYFPDGQTSVTVTLPLQGDDFNEPDEQFTVTLTNPVGATIARGIAIGTILNDDAGGPPPPPPSAPTFSIADFSATEADTGTATAISFTITRTSSVGNAYVSYGFAPGASPASAAGYDDFESGGPFFGTAYFYEGQTSVTITMRVRGDNEVEPDEQFTITLSNPYNAAIARGIATGTIINDDQPITGTDNGETITGTSDGDTIYALGGNDIVNGGAGNDIVSGGEGNDRLNGEAGDDTLYGDAGNDLLLSGTGSDKLYGGAGDDAFIMGAHFGPSDLVNGGADIDVVAIQGNYSGLQLGSTNLVDVETVSLLSGSDARFGDTANNRYRYSLNSFDSAIPAGRQLKVNGAALLEGEDLFFNGSSERDGSFFFYGGKGTDRLIGGAGNDVFFLAEGRLNDGDRFEGGAGADILTLRGDYSGANAVVFEAGAIIGIETISVLGVADTRFFAGGTPYSYELATDDSNVAAGATLTVNGGKLGANETLSFYGNFDTDSAFRLFGGAGADILFGGAGADLLYGGLGADQMNGGFGADIFRFDAVAESPRGAGGAITYDRIYEFQAGDRIDLMRIDANTANGSGNDAFTFVGTAAFTAAGQLRYSETTGGYFLEGDVDGDGAADLVIFVDTFNDLPPTASDFLL